MNPTNPPAAPPAAADTRFQKGNRGGPANPYARQCAQFRQALHEMVTKDDIQDLACDLLRLAKGGSLAAIKLLFAYVIGKPTPVPDPDRVELEDWKLLQEEVRHTREEVEVAFHGQPASTWTGPARVALDVNRTRIQADMLEQLGRHEEAVALRQAKLSRPDDPTTNGDSPAGAAAAAEPPPRPAYYAAGRPSMTNEFSGAPPAGGRPMPNGLSPAGREEDGLLAAFRRFYDQQR